MKNQSVVLLILLVIAIVAFIGFLVSILYRRWLHRKNEDIIFVSNGAGVRREHAVYCMLSDFILTKSYVHRLTKQYEMLEPGDARKVEHDVLRTLITVFGVCMGLLFVTLLMGLSLYSIVTMVLMMYIVLTYTTFVKVKKKEMLLLHQIKEFITEVRHQYYSSQSVSMALYDALLTAPRPIDVHMQKVYDVINSEDIEEETQSYNEHVPNRFLKMFLSICSTIMRFDDVVTDGKSLFIENLSHLKEELDIEILKKDMLSHVLGGLPIISVVIMFALKPYQDWAQRNDPSVVKYYTGTYGLIAFCGICIVSMIIYNVIINIYDIEFKTMTEHVYLDYILANPFVSRLIINLKNRNYGKTLKLDSLLHRIGEQITVEQLYVKRFLSAVGVMALVGFITIISHINTRNYLLNETFNVDRQIIVTNNDAVIAEIQELVVVGANAYRYDSQIDTVMVEEFVKSQSNITNDNWIKLCVDEIMRRITEYRNNYFMWYEMAVILLSSVAGYYAPMLAIRYRQQKLEINMENEVIQFQTGIMLLMHLKQMTIVDILKWMESFASVFRDSIAVCIDELPNGTLEALEKLREAEPYPAFVKLVDNLMDSDRIGIRQAFDEVEADRRTSGEKRRQDNQNYVDDMGAVAIFLSTVPALLTMFIYMCGPFFIESFSQFSKYTQLMESFM